jgi:outer membrane protein OmpA-like peptidoglycan-associated protein
MRPGVAGIEDVGLRLSRSGTLSAFIAALALAACQTAPRAHYAGPLIAPATNCSDISFPIYFEPDSAAVTSAAEQLIASAHDRASGCTVVRIDVLGLADAAGAPGANLTLSQRRAEAVGRALRRHGFAGASVNQGAAGAINAVTASGVERPLRRRADVTIHLTTPTAAGAH